MKKIILYIAASLDQRIAEPGGGLEWLTGCPNREKTDYGCKNLSASVDTVIMGGRTYREIMNMDVIWPYSEQMAYGWYPTMNGIQRRMYVLSRRILLKRFLNFAIRKVKIFG